MYRSGATTRSAGWRDRSVFVLASSPSPDPTSDLFRVRSPARLGLPVSGQVATLAVLPGSGRDNSRRTTRSGTWRVRSRLRRRAVRSSEFVHSACLHSIARLPSAEIIPRIFRIMDPSAVSARTLQGMARVRSGQAPAWPLASDRRRYRGSAVKGGRRSFPEETRSALDGGGYRRTLSGPSSDSSLTRTLHLT
jgi:hypothetical protein